MLYNVVFISAVQQSESVICIHIFPLFWISFPFRSPQSTELSFLCYTIGLHLVISFIHSITSVYMSIPIHGSIYLVIGIGLCEIFKTSLLLTFFSSVQFSRSVVSDSLRPHESQHAKPPCPSPYSFSQYFSFSLSPLPFSLSHSLSRKHSKLHVIHPQREIQAI